MYAQTLYALFFTGVYVHDDSVSAILFDNGHSVTETFRLLIESIRNVSFSYLLLTLNAERLLSNPNCLQSPCIRTRAGNYLASPQSWYFVYVFTLFKAEKVLSDVADDIGTVKNRRSTSQARSQGGWVVQSTPQHSESDVPNFFYTHRARQAPDQSEGNKITIPSSSVRLEET